MSTKLFCAVRVYKFYLYALAAYIYFSICLQLPIVQRRCRLRQLLWTALYQIIDLLQLLFKDHLMSKTKDVKHPSDD